MRDHPEAPTGRVWDSGARIEIDLRRGADGRLVLSMAITPPTGPQVEMERAVVSGFLTKLFPNEGPEAHTANLNAAMARAAE